ncbi:MAG: DUF47 family protein [Patescibacteria group bacterium]
MRKPSWLSGLSLLPMRDEEFYRLFGQMTSLLVSASDLVVELLNAGDRDRAHRLAERLKQYETDCDSIVRQTVTRLEVAAQPPFEREDITTLIKTLDDVIDWMERFANRYVTYYDSIDARGIEQLRELAAVVQGSCKTLHEAVACLQKRRGEVDGYCVKIHDLESQADDIHHHAIEVGNNGVLQLLGEVEPRIDELVRRIDGTNGPVDTTELTQRNTRAISDVLRVQRDMFQFSNLRVLLEALERASDASDRVATAMKKMVVNNV